MLNNRNTRVELEFRIDRSEIYIYIRVRHFINNLDVNSLVKRSNKFCIMRVCDHDSVSLDKRGLFDRLRP